MPPITRTALQLMAAIVTVAIALTLGCGSTTHLANKPIAASTQDQSQPGDTLTTLSFNIRNGTLDEGLDSWDARRHRVIETIADHDADLVALQEPVAEQVAELLHALPRYAAAGAHRLDGRIQGEGCVTLYDRTRFFVTHSGAFYLSDTPDVPGSITWDNAWPRVCTWVHLIEYGTGRGLYVYNLHLDNRGQQSRQAGAEMVRRDISRRVNAPHATDPVILMGDFNADPASPPLHTLTEASARPRLIDTLEGRPQAEGIGTYTAFDPASDGGSKRVDYVLASEHFHVIDASIDQRTIDGRYPSDHFPIRAVLRWPSPSQHAQP